MKLKLHPAQVKKMGTRLFALIKGSDVLSYALTPTDITKFNICEDDWIVVVIPSPEDQFCKVVTETTI